MSEVKGQTYRAAHVSQGLLSSLHPALPHADGKRPHDVAAELHRDATALQRRGQRGRVRDTETSSKPVDRSIGTRVRLTMTRFTRDTALRLMPHSHMTPNMLTRIMAMVMLTSTAAHSSKPSSTVVTTNIEARDTQRLRAVS